MSRSGDFPAFRHQKAAIGEGGSPHGSRQSVGESGDLDFAFSVLNTLSTASAGPEAKDGRRKNRAGDGEGRVAHWEAFLRLLPQATVVMGRNRIEQPLITSTYHPIVSLFG